MHTAIRPTFTRRLPLPRGPATARRASAARRPLVPRALSGRSASSAVGTTGLAPGHQIAEVIACWLLAQVKHEMASPTTTCPAERLAHNALLIYSGPSRTDTRSPGLRVV